MQPALATTGEKLHLQHMSLAKPTAVACDGGETLQAEKMSTVYSLHGGKEDLPVDLRSRLRLKEPVLGVYGEGFGLQGSGRKEVPAGWCDFGLHDSTKDSVQYLGSANTGTSSSAILEEHAGGASQFNPSTHRSCIAHTFSNLCIYI